MSENKILIPASLDSYGSRADGSLRLTFSTGIVNNDQLLVINSLKNHEGYLMFKDAVINETEKEVIDSLEVMTVKTKEKSKSQILRQKIWKNWKNHYEDKMSEEEYYNKRMDFLIKQEDQL